MRIVNAPPRPEPPATAWPAYQFSIILPILAKVLGEGCGYHLTGSGGCVTHIAKLAPLVVEI